MEALIHFAIWAAAFFLMMRFFFGAQVAGHVDGGRGAHGVSGAEEPNLRWVPPKRDVDPVCGMSVATNAAKTSVHDGYVYYFCSRDRREIFEATPHVYVSGDLQDGGQQPEHSHV